VYYRVCKVFPSNTIFFLFTELVHAVVSDVSLLIITFDCSRQNMQKKLSLFLLSSSLFMLNVLCFGKSEYSQLCCGGLEKCKWKIHLSHKIFANYKIITNVSNTSNHIYNNEHSMRDKGVPVSVSKYVFFVIQFLLSFEEDA
jgi:hypothetical protein